MNSEKRMGGLSEGVWTRTRTKLAISPAINTRTWHSAHQLLSSLTQNRPIIYAASITGQVRCPLFRVAALSALFVILSHAALFSLYLGGCTDRESAMATIPTRRPEYSFENFEDPIFLNSKFHPSPSLSFPYSEKKKRESIPFVFFILPIESVFFRSSWGRKIASRDCKFIYNLFKNCSNLEQCDLSLFESEEDRWSVPSLEKSKRTNHLVSLIRLLFLPGFWHRSPSPSSSLLLPLAPVALSRPPFELLLFARHLFCSPFPSRPLRESCLIRATPAVYLHVLTGKSSTLRTMLRTTLERCVYTHARSLILGHLSSFRARHFDSPRLETRFDRNAWSSPNYL